MRLCCGEIEIGLKPAAKFPMYHEDVNDIYKSKQYFPVKTFCMLLSFVSLVSVSYLTDRLLTSGKFPKKYDYFNVLERKAKAEKRIAEHAAKENATNIEMNTKDSNA